ncbi:hypothetical protein LSH36_130g01038 [Paralvinella palmiformis]|uniref:Uncharacterized protein n=1 Tax=Paralvinella palmiformis TaxID=53620 RepID=A0AAD9JWD3_9ANNE|nr:hypothetical protein LSH36_130g01038 [Paralvinella palmiformis]
MEDDQTSDFNVPSTASEGLQCFSRNVTYNVTTTDDTQMTLAVPEDMSLEVGERDGPPEMYEECVDTSKYFVGQISPEQYYIQGKAYTKAAIEDLLQSAEYLQRYTRCTLCWSIWCEGMYTASCTECGGYSMERPCPICQGRCGQIWKRDVEMSHSHNEAHWEGSCRLPEEKQWQFMTSILMDDGSEDSVLDGMEQLST